MKKAMIFTMDSVFALVLVALFMAMIFANVAFRPNIDVSDAIKNQYSADSLRVLYHDGTLHLAINDLNSTTIQQYLDYGLPDNICGIIDIRNESGFIIQAKRNGCVQLDVSYIHDLPLFYENKSYIARMVVW